jgi:hypothetical protein
MRMCLVNVEGTQAGATDCFLIGIDTCHCWLKLQPPARTLASLVQIFSVSCNRNYCRSFDAIMASAHNHFLTSTSSLEEDGCPSTLRDRLRDDDTPATSSSVGPIPYHNIYQQVHDCLGKSLTASKPSSKVVHAPKSNDQASQLRGEFLVHNLAPRPLTKDRIVCSNGHVTPQLCY